MATATIAPFGSWRSPISAALVAAGSKRLNEVRYAAGAFYWVEERPEEGGRPVIVRCEAGGSPEEVLPAGYSARTRVHEYGGGAYLLAGDTLFFSNLEDQRLYRLDPGSQPWPITPEPERPSALRYADGVATADGRWIICVLEQHTADGTVANQLVTLVADGSAPPQPIATGRDFYSSPRMSPDGRRLAWLTWDMPQMPWDGTELWTADLLPDGSLSGARRFAGGPEESLFQPEWRPDGVLHVMSDRSGWWNLYREETDRLVPLAPVEADLGFPQWGFGLSRYAFLSEGRIACIVSQDGFEYLGLIERGGGRIQPVETGYTAFMRPFLVGDGQDRLGFVAGNPSQAPAVVTMRVSTGQIEVLWRAASSGPSNPATCPGRRPSSFRREAAKALTPGCVIDLSGFHDHGC